MEREIVDRMQNGNFALESKPAIYGAKGRDELLSRHPQLNEAQHKAADQILASQEKIVGLDGIAGAGKTTTLAVIREGAEANGYRLEGFAPTSRAAQNWVRLASRPPRCNFISRRDSRPIPARGDSTSWTRVRLLPPSRCTTS